MAPCGALFKGGSSEFQLSIFSKGRSTLLKKGSHKLTLYCLIQTVSLFKNIFGFLSKDKKISVKNIIKNVGVYGLVVHLVKFVNSLGLIWALDENLTRHKYYYLCKVNIMFYKIKLKFVVSSETHRVLLKGHPRFIPGVTKGLTRNH